MIFEGPGPKFEPTSTPKWLPRRPKRPLGASWRRLGASWGRLGASWGRLGLSWGPLGRSWGRLGPSWGGFWHPSRAKWGVRRPRGAPKCAGCAGVRRPGVATVWPARASWNLFGRNFGRNDLLTDRIWKESCTPCTRGTPRGRRIEDARGAGHTAAPAKVPPRGRQEWERGREGLPTSRPASTRERPPQTGAKRSNSGGSRGIPGGGLGVVLGALGGLPGGPGGLPGESRGRPGGLLGVSREAPGGSRGVLGVVLGGRGRTMGPSWGVPDYPSISL